MIFGFLPLFDAGGGDLATLLKPHPPAPGFRDSGWRGVDAGGTLCRIGSDGYGWPSTIPTDGAEAYYFGFHCDGIFPNNTNRRACGFQLRCLQE